MKLFLLFSSVISCITIFTQNSMAQENYPPIPTQQPTYANYPTVENVLVVYRLNNSVSNNIKNHYVDRRSIPISNVLGLSINASQPYPTGTVILDQGDEVIRNSGDCWESTTEVCDNIAWQFYKDYIETPIKNHLNTTYNQNGDLLKDVIRYIVLCKGIPHKIRSGHIWIGGNEPNNWAHKTRINVSVDALLCLINNNTDILTLYNNPPTPVTPPLGLGMFADGADPVSWNPYFSPDEETSFSFDYRFLPNYFTSETGWKLNYLVSRLDGKNLDEVILMIDRSLNTDKSGLSEWVIDDRPDQFGQINNDFLQAKNRLSYYGFNVYYDDTPLWLTGSNSQIIGYTSYGANTPASPTYILDLLQFSYNPGAVFSSMESFNAWAMNPIYRNGQGLLSDFLQRRSVNSHSAGTAGAGYTWEPLASAGFGTILQISNFYPAFAIGYGIVDAAYMGMRRLAWQNVVFGDPLLSIAWGKQTLTENLTWSGTNLVTGTITVPSGKTLTIASNAVINFKHLGSLQVNGALVIQPGAQLNFHNGKSIEVNGSLTAHGTSNNRIQFDFYNSVLAGIKINAYASLNISYCDIEDAKYGILTEPGFSGLNSEHVNISNCTDGGIGIFGPYGFDSDITPAVKNCTITNCEFGIYAANVQEIVLYQNTINNCNVGIGASLVPAAYIIGNNINSNATPTLPGIMLYSSNGNVRANTVRNHTDGIYLGNSSPDIGDNTLEDNLYHGLYIGSGSVPNLVAHIAGEPPIFWAISGYNTIKENGNITGGREDNDGSEIYIYDADIILEKGCNIIADDRTYNPELPTIFLMNGKQRDYHEINAVANYWGTVGPSNERFGDLPVIFEPYNYEPCPFPQSQCQELMVETSKGEFIDELAPRKCDVGPLSAIEESYAEANMLYANGEVNAARQIYEQITASENTPIKKLYAYNKLYTIGNLIDTTDNYFSVLQNIFSNLAQTIEDSTLMKIFAHNSTLCKVSKEEYVSAITDFENIIIQNPNSEEAFHAEMDLMTTSLLLDTSSSQLGKTESGKYFVKGSNDYMTKLNQLIKRNFGVDEENAIKDLLPEEFTLMQNYPNPFNPVTKIEYSISKDTRVELKVFDVLGREVKTLVDNFQPFGKYSVAFDATDLSSGVYFYKLVAQGFVKSRKAVVIK